MTLLMPLRLIRFIPFALVAVAAGCSVIYDGDSFQYNDASPPPDAFMAPDADVAALSLTALVPNTVFEGQGCASDGSGGCETTSRAVPIVIQGDSIVPGATVTLDGTGFDQVVVPAEISADGTLAAFELSVPIIDTLDEGATSTIKVTVAQADFSMSLDLTVQGLDEFIATRDTTAGVPSEPLRPRYSSVRFDGPVTFAGTEPARIVATAEIVVDAALSVRGAHAADGGAGGPGGCNGGAAVAPGTCEAGGGQGGTNSGGGGGGHGTVATNGSGNSGGMAGAASGTPELVPLGGVGVMAARGHGGGGGGRGALGATAPGGAGGGGGGVLELTSAGSIEFTANAAIDASGGDGDGGGGLSCALGEHGGGGGGGSGGAVLLRGLMSMSDSGSGQRVDISGGVGLSGGSGCNTGGAGAVGRVRVDSPHDAAVPAVVAGIGTLHRGPVLSPATQSIVRQAAMTVEVFGGSAQAYHVRVGAGAPVEVTTLVNSGSVQVTLEEGSNQVCALARADVGSSPEGVNCVLVAYIP